MKTFKQHLNALEKSRKEEKKTASLVGVLTSYVHGKHAIEPTKGVLSDVVHGSHAKKEVNEQTTEFSDFVEKYKTDNDIDGLDRSLQQHYTPHLKAHKDLEHVSRYTSASGVFNRSLIDQHIARQNGNEIELSDSYEARKNGLDNILRSHQAPRDFYTYSGMGPDPKRLVNSENKFYSPAYLSSSIDPGIAASFAKTHQNGKPIESMGHGEIDHDAPKEQHILRIPVKKGSTQGSYVNGVSNFGPAGGAETGGEQEFLQNRGMTYTVHPTPDVYKDGNHVIHVWDVIDISHGDHT
jgi:hypothetical protein